ncbi:hypothetical protein [Bosea sp. ANAM02]|uniref:hypothetical protein n=1 Tax=Bosea sp. ANAM02 TaxID=2020412 RepID=UPI00140EB0C8|nr:hypothetical protein [Bosea sp. ANAM02]BCB22325.1 hypothetical protein OCUBac02_52190 [Bosea sp. ANAM02]
MDLIAELGRSIDPEAFDTDLFSVPLEKGQELAERKRKISTGLVEGFAKLDERYKVVELPVPPHTGEYYEIDGYRAGKGQYLSLSAKRLGEFLVTLIQMKGDLVSVYCLSPNHRNAHVMAIVRLHPDRKAEFEAATNLVLNEPTRVVLA